ncbi:7225_t:CDS:2 [Entrophospora sp. SA101]|nr:7225_t:CDS:2 [Entrophospora sp. SA101]CAJ0908836.1 2850_t:CDS:2 [Entrophospora sp. SA101]CAJ0918562.1 1446_t:CDS:2 [Entrophospora sp. SA101]
MATNSRTGIKLHNLEYFLQLIYQSVQIDISFESKLWKYLLF